MLIREAKRQGVDHIVVTHAMKAPIQMNVEQMKQAAALGAYLEFDYSALLGPEAFDISQYAGVIRAVGPAACILSSDLGQAGNPLHPDGLLAFFKALREKGFSVQEIDRMSKINPSALLGLP